MIVKAILTNHGSSLDHKILGTIVRQARMKILNEDLSILYQLYLNQDFGSSITSVSKSSVVLNDI